MELLRVFRHLIECAQSTTTAYYELQLPLLSGTSKRLAHLQQQITPNTANTIGHKSTVHKVNGNPIQNQMIKDQWAVNKKYFEEDQNMNKALTKSFFELVPAAQRQGYKDILVGDPNRRFEATFAYFYDN